MNAIADSALFLPSTPLHSFWSIGLAAGPFAGSTRNMLALIDQRPGDTEYVSAAAEAIGFPHIAEYRRFARIGKRPIDKLRVGRRITQEVRDHSARLQPSLVLVGNDRRAEFYAALDGHPRALGGYIDDGLFSYVSRPGSSRTRWTNRIAQWSRRAVYGFAVEKPGFVGGSRAVREAWVMLPYQVHEGLDGKQVRRLRPEWFRLPAARAVYAQAMASAGVDAAQIARVRLLVLLPHDAFLREHPELLDALARAVRRHREAGHEVALKRHPRSEAGILPPELSSCVEIPRRIPVEILAPFLDDAEIVGSLTSAMITLVKLGANVRARSLAPVSASHGRMGEVYRASGVGPLQPAALSYLL